MTHIYGNSTTVLVPVGISVMIRLCPDKNPVTQSLLLILSVFMQQLNHPRTYLATTLEMQYTLMLRHVPMMHNRYNKMVMNCPGSGLSIYKVN